MPHNSYKRLGTTLLKKTIKELTSEFLIQHHKGNPYHPQEKGTIDAFNKILENGLTKVGFANRYDWDEWIPTILWAYMTTTKNIHK